MRYVLVWCAKGSATAVVDDKELLINAGEVLTITSGQYHCFKQLTESESWVLEFTLDFFCKDDNDIELIFHNGLLRSTSCIFTCIEEISKPN